MIDQGGTRLVDLSISSAMLAAPFVVRACVNLRVDKEGPVLQTHGYELVSVPLGARWSIVGIVLENGRQPIVEFLDSPGADAAAFFAFVNILLNAEPFKQIGKRFKRLKHVANVFQITNHHERYLGFRWGRVLILTNAFRKRTAETPRDEIETSGELQRLFFKQHGG